MSLAPLLQVCANIAQLNNIRFFYRHLQQSTSSHAARMAHRQLLAARLTCPLSVLCAAAACDAETLLASTSGVGLTSSSPSPSQAWLWSPTAAHATRPPHPRLCTARDAHADARPPRCVVSAVLPRVVWQLAALGCVVVPLYWLCFICLSYRWNAHHLLYTILHKHSNAPYVQQGSAITPHSTRTTAQQQHFAYAHTRSGQSHSSSCCHALACRFVDSDRGWHVDVLLWLAVLGLVNGALLQRPDWPQWLQWPLPLLFSAYLLALNLRELLDAIPVLERVQREKRESHTTAAAAASAAAPPAAATHSSHSAAGRA